MSNNLEGRMPSKSSKAKSDAASEESPKRRSQAKSEFTTKMDGVMQLLNQRMEGRVSTTQVESAVDDLLVAMGAPRDAGTKNNRRTTTASGTTCPRNETATFRRKNHKKPQSASSIYEDDGNYDDSSDDENERKKKIGDPSTSLKEPKKKKRRLDESESEITDSSNGNLHDIKQSSHDEKDNNEAPPLSSMFANDDAYRDAISRIPMGVQAAKMMTTFGDGPRPLPDPIELALMGTRKALQVSIMDARKVRRRLQKEYRDAQSIVNRYTPNNKYRKSDKQNPTVAAAAAWVAEQHQQQSAPTLTKAYDTSQIASTFSSEIQGNGNREIEVESNEIGTTPATTPSESQKPSTPATIHPSVNSIDPRIIYRALAEGTDKLAYAHKCGFHMEELTHLYPEEMSAYQRWNELHEEYNESKADDGVGTDGNKDKEGGDATKGNKNSQNEPDGGHLRERAANFDYRTDHMKNEWYVEYSKVRQGSFLPSSGRVKRTKTEIEWDRLRKLKKGRHAAGEWENITGRAVRFLHWLGFDPPNLYPPDEETTQALAFLAYDRLGRIVEKAIFLRNEKDDKARSLWELPSGEQLSFQDIERALQDPDVKPATVYGTEDSKDSSSVQLYFGPGWEDRLELEMEEMIATMKGSNHRLSEEERMVRDHEMELLAKISAPPARDGDHLETLVNKHKESATE